MSMTQRIPVSTPYHAKYLAHELTKRVSADNAEKLSQSLCNATVDLNPHQVEAAFLLFVRLCRVVRCWRMKWVWERPLRPD
jgi:hypothetical protein